MKTVRIGQTLAVLLAVIVIGGYPSAVHAGGTGRNVVKSSSSDPVGNAGYGPGWVLLSHKPNCPGVGYLFDRDEMDILSAYRGDLGYTQKPKITRWPWGYAKGHFNGCASAYGMRKFDRKGKASSSCPTPPTRGHHCDDGIFCTDNRADSLCAKDGVWGIEDKPSDDSLKNGKDAYSLECPAYANIGAAGAYSTGLAVPADYLGTVPFGDKLDVRYVTRSREWVWGKRKNGSIFPKKIAWAFFPRWCVSETLPRCGDGWVYGPREVCDDGNTNGCDGCSSDCRRLEGHGDGVTNCGEECDDGNFTSGDGCDTNWTTSRCGNGIVAGTEQCEPSVGIGCPDPAHQYCDTRSCQCVRTYACDVGCCDGSASIGFLQAATPQDCRTLVDDAGFNPCRDHGGRTWLRMNGQVFDQAACTGHCYEKCCNGAEHAPFAARDVGACNGSMQCQMWGSLPLSRWWLPNGGVSWAKAYAGSCD